MISFKRHKNHKEKTNEFEYFKEKIEKFEYFKSVKDTIKRIKERHNTEKISAILSSTNILRTPMNKSSPIEK